jgi:hypothetical protein
VTIIAEQLIQDGRVRVSARPWLSVAVGNKIVSDASINAQFLKEQGFLKTHSLLEASRAGVDIPRTLLVLDNSPEVVFRAISEWDQPPMIRVEYQKLPQNKIHGGIPAFSSGTLEKFMSVLRRDGCYTVIHPWLDRFKNVYSVGLLLSRDDQRVNVEIVGGGFDAGDLRLGLAIPHQRFVLDPSRNMIEGHSLISHEDYLKEREQRWQRILQLRDYTRLANETGKLLSVGEIFSRTVVQSAQIKNELPTSYRPLPGDLLNKLRHISAVMQNEVVGNLPVSKEYVASLSFFERRGFLLWDVYGHWYLR